ncbi:uncharacterized protein GGS22DRAFT_171417 [Annulohypoxylon maeteangense]|uniref:uncharacterized protein n=1 Tax=Annulohypoxylon maeteangense TaxID=1927788 RepID=UPI0020077203|nr:uncharacterized protein GGS22DRAFT_171417 [Annulohypoxylon maeteangense]KAI0882052.1 hypothetical protein GGS22DRAFT_171417 [Annulohypoxylon maeteangense]
MSKLHIGPPIWWFQSVLVLAILNASDNIVAPLSQCVIIIDFETIDLGAPCRRKSCGTVSFAIGPAAITTLFAANFHRFGIVEYGPIHLLGRYD